MILFPRITRQAAAGCVPVWQAIEETQHRRAGEYWLVAQPDHAALAGNLADNIQSSLFPALDFEIIQAIALHDEGWREFDGTPTVKDGHPVSFLEVPAADFLQAWKESIRRAEEVAPIAGVLVSEHFCRLGQYGLTRQMSDREIQMLQEFLRGEEVRQQVLRARQSRSAQAIRVLVDVLQFFDLLSLYLCCGSSEQVEFPQVFSGGRIQLHHEQGLCQTTPALFGEGLSLAVPAVAYPRSKSASIPVLIQ